MLPCEWAAMAFKVSEQPEQRLLGLCRLVVWLGGPGGLRAGGGCQCSRSDTAGLLLPEPRGPSCKSVRGSTWLAGSGEPPPPASLGLHILLNLLRGFTWPGQHCQGSRDLACLMCALEATPEWPPAPRMQARPPVATPPGTGL